MQQLTETTPSTPKYRIGLEIHRTGSENDAIIRAISNVNEGKSQMMPAQLMGYIDIRNAMWPINTQTTYISNWPELHIFEGEKNYPTLSLTWKEIHELSETEKEIEAGLEPDHGVIVLTIGEETAEETKERIDSNQEPDDIKDLFHASSQD